VARIGLVLGAGGEVGHAFHAGVLAALGDVTGWDARDADVVVGTSAGAIAGALLRAGLSGTDLAARATGQSLTDEGRRLLARSDSGNAHLRPIPRQRPSRRVVPTMSAPGALVRAALQPWKARFGSVVAAALPAGRVPTEVISAGIRPLFDQWPDAPLWTNVVELHTGRRVTFGRDLAYDVDVATAVAASCAIPTFFAPVEVDGVRFVDGGAHSPTNADLVAGIGLDLVVVSSPMSIVGNALRFAPDQPSRRLARFVLGREVARIRRAGTPVLTFQPTRDDLAVMGADTMDATKRADVARRARASASAHLMRPHARDRIDLLAPPPSRGAIVQDSR
jgi:NTE family protein